MSIQIEDFSGDAAKFKVYKIEKDRVIFQTVDRAISCVRICYKSKTNDEKICDDK